MDDKVVKIAKEVAGTKELMENQELREQLFEARENIKSIIGIDIPEDMIIQIAVLFNLPDNQFVAISQEFLNQFENSLNNNSDKIALCRMLNLSDIKIEDIIQMTDKWNEIIDIQLKDTLNSYKRSFLKQLFGIVMNVIMDSEGISKRIIQIPIVVEDEAIVPTYANVSDAGADVYAFEDITIEPGETKIVKTGIRVAIPKGYEIQVRPRSGLSVKSKLRIANAPGTIDSGYRDEIGIICENVESKIKNIGSHYEEDKLIIDSIEYGSPIIIEKGQRIAQLVLSEVPTINFMKVDDLSTENDRNGGFGSTGV